MKFLFDIGHPENVHIFKHIAWRLQRDGHHAIFTARDKEVSVDLLRAYGLPFHRFGPHYTSLLGKAFGLVRYDLTMLLCLLREKPDLVVSHGSICAAHGAWLLGVPHVSLEDTENSYEQIRLYAPFTSTILTSSTFNLDLGPKQIRYDGYHELAYLHPTLFPRTETKDSTIRRKRVFIRLTAWGASHDRGQSGIDKSFRSVLLSDLAKEAEVFVSVEGRPPEGLEPQVIRLAPEKMHSFLATMDLYVGEGATMASECSALGVPSIYVNSQVPSYLRQQSDVYGLITITRNEEAILNTAREILRDPSSKARFSQCSERMYRDKIHVHEFLYWLITRYPESVLECKRDRGLIRRRFMIPATGAPGSEAFPPRTSTV